MSAAPSKLYEIAKSLQTWIAYLFEGLIVLSTARAEGVAGHLDFRDFISNSSSLRVRR